MEWNVLTYDRVSRVRSKKLKTVIFPKISHNEQNDSIQKIFMNPEAMGICVDHDYLKTIVKSKFSCDTLPGTLKDMERNPENRC